MLYKVFDFAEKEAADVMVPRPDVVALSVDVSRRRRSASCSTRRTRATRSTVSRSTTSSGSCTCATSSRRYNDAGIAEVELAELLRPTHVVPETKDLGALLGEFRRTNQHMAVVVDEYGSTMGIVTLEDLLEEIVGDIEDEFDLPDESVERIDERTIRIDGTFTIDDFNEEFGTTLEHEDFHTVAGSSSASSVAPPSLGTRCRADGLRFTVLETRGRGSIGCRSSSCRAAVGDGEHERTPDQRAVLSLRHRDFVALRRVRGRDAPRSRWRPSRSAGRCTRSAASRSISGSSGSRCSSRCRCSRCPPDSSPTGSRGGTCSARASSIDVVVAARAAGGDAFAAPSRLAVLRARVRDGRGVGSRRACLSRALADARAARDPVGRSRSAPSRGRPSVAGPALGGILFAIRPALVYGVGAALSLHGALVGALPPRAGPTGRHRLPAREVLAGVRSSAEHRCCSARSPSISSPCSSAARSPCSRCSRRTSSTSARPGSAPCVARRPSARSARPSSSPAGRSGERAGRHAAHRRRGCSACR